MAVDPGTISMLAQAGEQADPTPKVLGAGQLIQSARKRSQAERATPPMEDQEMREILMGVRRRRRAVGTGAAAEGARRELEQAQQRAERGVLRASGGAGGAAIAGISRGQRQTQGAMNELLARLEQQRDAVMQMEAGMTQRMAQRRLDLGLLERAQLMAESAQMRQAGMQNLLGSEATDEGATADPQMLAQILGGGTGGTGGTPQKLPTRQAPQQLNAPPSPPGTL